MDGILIPWVSWLPFWAARGVQPCNLADCGNLATNRVLMVCLATRLHAFVTGHMHRICALVTEVQRQVVITGQQSRMQRSSCRLTWACRGGVCTAVAPTTPPFAPVLLSERVPYSAPASSPSPPGKAPPADGTDLHLFRIADATGFFAV